MKDFLSFFLRAGSIVLAPILLSSVVVVSSEAASYAVPQGYDNIINAQNSLAYGVLTNASASVSGNFYVIGGESVRYKCLVVPKIVCRGSAVDPLISAVVSEISLRDPVSDENLPVFNSDVRIEKDAVGTGNFYVCAAAYGGITFDEFTMSSASGSLSYIYKGNINLRSFVYFSNKAASTVPANHSGSGSAGSYISIEHKQVCQ
jgi:hypothetical protein